MLLDYIKTIFEFLAAIAWPVAIFSALWLFRKQIENLLGAVPALLGRVKTMKFPNFEVEAELERQSEAAAVEDRAQKVPEEQVRAAVRIKNAAQSAGAEAIRAQVGALAQEYETTRANMPPGRQRTIVMNQVMAKMRTMALAAEPLLPELMSSDESAGRRLMALAILQVNPNPEHLKWLVSRMSVEMPFLLFHTSLALRQFVDKYSSTHQNQLKDALNKALAKVKSFPGKPDQNTIDTLEAALDDLNKNTARVATVG
jgi:hypothetical protein